MTDELTLLPCPFCGGNGKLIESHRYDASVDSTPPHWKVSCECVGCNGAAINIWRQSEEEALKAWNARIESEDINRMRNLLEDVVNALDLSEIAVETHGPLGTEPAELVKLVLQQKDREIALLRHEPDNLPEWAKHEINMHYIMAARESSEIIRELNKNSPVAVGDPYFSGYLAALRWVLSLRKPEAHS